MEEEDNILVNEEKISLDNMLGLLKVKVRRGVNLIVRDVGSGSSDPYVVIKMGKQKLKTRVVKKSINPEWNEDLTLYVDDPEHPVKLIVYDKDTLSVDDKMGEAEFDIKPFMKAVKTNVGDLPSGTIIKKEMPNRENCLSGESCIVWSDGKVIQDMCLRLRNVESGEVELELQWVELPKMNVL